MSQKHYKPKPAPIAVETEVEEVLEAPQEALEAPVEAPADIEQAKTYTAQDGDTYASLGDKFKPAGKTKHEHAKHLFALNGGKSIVPGTVIKL